MLELTTVQVGIDSLRLATGQDQQDFGIVLGSVRVIRPNLLFCVHQRNSEGICRRKGECRGLSGMEGIIGGVIWGYREEEVSYESIQEGFEEIEVVVG